MLFHGPRIFLCGSWKKPTQTVSQKFNNQLTSFYREIKKWYLTSTNRCRYKGLPENEGVECCAHLSRKRSLQSNYTVYLLLRKVIGRTHMCIFHFRNLVCIIQYCISHECGDPAVAYCSCFDSQFTVAFTIETTVYSYQKTFQCFLTVLSQIL